MKNRTELLSLIRSLEYIKERYVYIGKDIIPLSTQKKYDQVLEHYNQLIQTLTEELNALPIGYRYTGTYYLKKPYTIPAEFEKCKGSLYMRENLVSWQIEKEDGKLDYTYYRAVYKKPHGELIKREEAKPVYPTEKNNA
jgi:hypothetical protein